jgi:signal transduction histidine kinase
LENAFSFQANRKEGHQIIISACITQNNLIVEISDNGPGIPLEYHKTIFDMFYKVGTHGSSSTGLGLYFAKKAVEKMFGFISLNSNDLGSTFFITIPISKSALN